MLHSGKSSNPRRRVGNYLILCCPKYGPKQHTEVGVGGQGLGGFPQHQSPLQLPDQNGKYDTKQGPIFNRDLN